MQTKLPNNQSGVSLLLAVLVLSAITSIAFSLATVVLIEIRSSGDILRTEPALYGTLGVTEEALFQYKRFVADDTNISFDVSTCEGPSKFANVCNFLDNRLTINPGSIQVVDENPKVDVLYLNTPNSYPLYQQHDFSPDYGRVTVQVLDNNTDSTVQFQIYQTSNSDANPVIVLDRSITVGDGVSVFNSFSNNNQYDLVLTQTEGANNALVSITTYSDAIGRTQLGMPFLNQQVLKIVANYLGLTRTYTVRIPIP